MDESYSVKDQWRADGNETFGSIKERNSLNS